MSEGKELVENLKVLSKQLPLKECDLVQLAIEEIESLQSALQDKEQELKEMAKDIASLHVDLKAEKGYSKRLSDALETAIPKDITQEQLSILFKEWDSVGSRTMLDNWNEFIDSLTNEGGEDEKNSTDRKS